jgi:hypothetical protein
MCGNLTGSEERALFDKYQKSSKAAKLHFIAVKNGSKFHYHEKTEFDARTKASVELGTCSDFYQFKERNNEA